ncbi:MAG: O-succinylhomoserine sulfhydrylase [Rhodospirillaceae bacterium]|nr:O-succinylhomoserine sulfhydrylase [Rhodospirillaceae bacterium]MBT7512562.1 O-succinylhomoserine sulfhydrylase [Rhodospirillaceae bacterium]
MTRIKDTNENWRAATQLVRGGTQRSGFDETSEAIFMTSGYVYDTAEDAEQAFKGEKERYIYGRYGNPTVTMFEERLGLLEGAKHCVATASGMAAVFAALASQVKAGDRVVASRALFGSCHYIVDELLPKYGVHTNFVDGTDLIQWERALSEPTAAVFLETPSNPTLEIIDLERVAEMAHVAGARLIVDNVFATPILQHPLELGADIVMYSATKHIDGQGRTLGGAILTNDDEFIDDHLTPFMRHTGPALSPMNAWVLLKGIETLKIRVDRHCRSAGIIAEFLADHDGISRVLYPGLENHPQYDLAQKQMAEGGTMVTFEVTGGKAEAFRFLNALNIVDISNNLGDAKSLTTHPATTTHQRLSEEDRAHLGITDGMIRLSVGLEDCEDLLEDLDQALKAMTH